MAGNRHTIVLMQTSQNRATRTFMDYGSINQAMDACDRVSRRLWQFKKWQSLVVGLYNAGICGLYERKLKDLNPTIRNINYDISDLYNFIDGLADMSALVYEHSVQAYLPYDRKWIKAKLLQHLKKLAQ